MAESGHWLIDKTRPLSATDLDELDRELAVYDSLSRGASETPQIAVLLHDVVIHDNKKWFGEAQVRLDALVITGEGRPEDASSFYMPRTASFIRIHDEDRLPIGAGGLLLFHGRVRHFLDVSIMVSRDRKDSRNLAELLTGKLGSDEIQGAVAGLLGLAAATPSVAAVTAAIGAAAVLGEAAFQVLQTATGATIGLYRNSHLQVRDGFGIGLHPGPGTECFRVKDMSFRYEIVLEENPSQ